MYLVESGFSKENQEQIKDGWKTVKLMIERIRKMVLDILFYAKERDLKWERVAALTFAEEVAQVVEPKITAQAIEFVKEFDAATGNFEIDAGYVHSALINIIENAIDACTRVTEEKHHKIVFSVRQDKTHILFEVFDSGIGMDSETVDKLFTPFFSSKGRKGTGLGLFISNKIIKQHGGTIVVKSTPGHGSLFTIKIPKRLPNKAKQFTRAAAPLARQPPDRWFRHGIEAACFKEKFLCYPHFRAK